MDTIDYAGSEQVTRNLFSDRTVEIFNRLADADVASLPFSDISGPPSRNKGGVAADDALFSFKATSNGDMTASMLSGGITLGPFTRIEWGYITDASTDITVSDGTETWWVWLSIDCRDDDVNSPSASWHEGDINSYWSGLTDDEKKYTTLVPLVYITASNKAVDPDPANWTIDEVKNLQCGDIYIPRL